MGALRASTASLFVVILGAGNSYLGIRVSSEKGRPPKAQSSIHMQYGPHREHSTWVIGLKNTKDFEQLAFQQLLERSAVAFSADIGYIHKITEMETSRGLASESIGFLNTAKTDKHLFLFTRLLNKCLPDIYWTTVSRLVGATITSAMASSLCSPPSTSPPAASSAVLCPPPRHGVPQVP
jgi:hypothetical protein